MAICAGFDGGAACVGGGRANPLMAIGAVQTIIDMRLVVVRDGLPNRGRRVKTPDLPHGKADHSKNNNPQDNTSNPRPLHLGVSSSSGAGLIGHNFSGGFSVRQLYV